MEDNNEQEYGIVFMELLVALKEKIGAIIAATLAAALLGWVVSAFLITPQYEASVNMIVNTKTDVSGTLTNDEISSAQKLVDTYAIIVKSNKVLNQVISTLNLDMSYDDLCEIVTVEPINDTLVMKIAVRTENPALAKQIVETITAIAPDIVKEAVEAGSCKVVSEVAVGDEPVFPEVQKVTIVAAVLGLMVCVAIIVLRELLNDFIVDDKDVERKLGIPTLGIIPDVERM